MLLPAWLGAALSSLCGKLVEVAPCTEAGFCWLPCRMRSARVPTWAAGKSKIHLLWTQSMSFIHWKKKTRSHLHLPESQGGLISQRPLGAGAEVCRAWGGSQSGWIFVTVAHFQLPLAPAPL